MPEIQYVSIGYTKKTHGLKGELKMSIEARYAEDFLKNERIFLDVKGVKVPYFIANVRGAGEWIVQLEDVENKEAAYALQSREIFLRQQDLLPDHKRVIEVEDESLEYEDLIGYTIVDQQLGTIGAIDEVLEMPQQEMAFLRYKNREVLIPLNDTIIVSIDEAKRTVTMDLPEGLLDM